MATKSETQIPSKCVVDVPAGGVYPRSIRLSVREESCWCCCFRGYSSVTLASYSFPKAEKRNESSEARQSESYDSFLPVEAVRALEPSTEVTVKARLRDHTKRRVLTTAGRLFGALLVPGTRPSSLVLAITAHGQVVASEGGDRPAADSWENCERDEGDTSSLSGASPSPSEDVSSEEEEEEVESSLGSSEGTESRGGSLERTAHRTPPAVSRSTPSLSRIVGWLFIGLWLLACLLLRSFDHLTDTLLLIVAASLEGAWGG